MISSSPADGGETASWVRRSNSFDGLRLLGALAVIWGHSYLLTGKSTTSPVLLGYPVQTLGVVVFFSISGYLITASWQRSPYLRSFMAARCLRIFPALLVVVGCAVFVIGPLATTLSLSEYFDRRDAWTYLGNGLLRFQQTLPGVWDDLPDRAVNGSLWTLPVEFIWYLAVPAVLSLSRRLRPLAVMSLILALVVVSFSDGAGQIQVWNTHVGGIATMGLFFVAGALIRVVQQRGFPPNPWVAGLLLAAHIGMVALVPGFQWHFGWVTVPYVVLCVGLARIPILRSGARWGDFSYGLYLWGYPVQQLVVDAFGALPAWQNLPLVLLLTGGLAVASWRFVEAPALALKGRLAGRLVKQPALSGTS